MSFKFITCDELGHIYAVTDSGDMLYYQDEARDGTMKWAFGGQGQLIGTGWGDFLHVFASEDGIIYAVASNGDLLFYKDTNHDGTLTTWANGGVGQQIGTGWGDFLHVFAGGDGVIYAVAPNGDLLYYKDNARNGQQDWANGGVGQLIGTEWAGFLHVFSGGDGVIYAVAPNGDLLFYKDLVLNGDNLIPGVQGWAYGGIGQKIGSGWGGFPEVFSGGDGRIYAITTDGFLFYYKVKVKDGSFGWAYAGIGETIGWGWFISHGASGILEAIYDFILEGLRVIAGWFDTVTGWFTPSGESLPDVAGYCTPLSAAPGETVEFKISASSAYEVTFVHLKKQADGSMGIPKEVSFNMGAGVQSAPEEACQHGCGWHTSFTKEIPSDWPSGIYAARCKGLLTEFYIVFIVKPDPAQKKEIAVLANTNTWTAYNDWGGGSKYTKDSERPGGAFARPNPYTMPINAGGNHLTAAELWVLNWLEAVDEVKAVDVYSDADFHFGIDGFHQYKALILNTHPEYWTLEMLDNLETYLLGGGNLLYLGGNGIFERCEFSENANALIFFGGDPSQGRERNFFRNLSFPNMTPRPERAILGVATLRDNIDILNTAAYRVEKAGAAHPFSKHLTEGSLIGEKGRNGGASGWEMDSSDPGDAPDGVIVSAMVGDDRGKGHPFVQLLARGINEPLEGQSPHTAHMTYCDYMVQDPQGAFVFTGGFVFSVGSICFGGSLVQDQNLQTIVTNALRACLNQ